jgi:hypothetical protein
MAIQNQEDGATLVPTSTPSPLPDLFSQLSAAFEAERALGFSTDNNQPEESFSRLDAKVRALIKRYIEGGSNDWRCYVNFNEVSSPTRCADVLVTGHQAAAKPRL